MDGLPHSLAPDVGMGEMAIGAQCTLKAPIGCVGTGLHSGRRVSLTFRPAQEDHGIVFRRVDLGVDIPARFDHVVDTRLCTVLERHGARVGTVEHVMAALAGCSIDNAVVEIDGSEPPVFDVDLSSGERNALVEQWQAFAEGLASVLGPRWVSPP